MTPGALEPELRVRVLAVVEEARVLIAQRIRDDGYMPTISQWPSLRRFESGFPSVDHSTLGSEKPDYGHLFTRTGRDYGAISFERLAGLPGLIEYVESRPELARRIAMSGVGNLDDDTARRWFEISVARLPLDVVDRCVHLYGPHFADGSATEIYAQIERGILADSLPIELWVPIALTAFDDDVDCFELVDRVSIRRIPDDLQLARVPPRVYGGTVHELVLQAASHAFVFEGFEMPNEHRWAMPTNSPNFYPLDTIDTAFQAIRLGIEHATGYAQIFIRTLGWAHHFNGDLPPVLHGATLRRYPPAFDDGGWNAEPVGRMGESELVAVQSIYERLLTAPARLKLATRQLSGALLRESEEDAILDLCIGLEAALSDKSKNDITFKLALRVAGLLRSAGTQESAPDLFDITTKIYDYRSTVVHGDKPGDARTIKLSGNRELSAVVAAEQLLRGVVRELLSNPRTPRQIDRDLIVGSLSRLREPAEKPAPRGK